MLKLYFSLYENLMGKEFYDYLMLHVKAKNWYVVDKMLNFKDINNINIKTLRDTLVHVLNCNSKESELFFINIIKILSQNQSSFQEIIHGVMMQTVKAENLIGFNKLKNDVFTKQIVKIIVNMPTKYSSLTALHVACDNQDHEMLQSILLINKIDITKQSCLGRTPIQIAALRTGQSESGDFSIIQMLLVKYLENGISISQKEKQYIENNLNAGPSNLILDFQNFCHQYPKLFKK